MKLFITKLNQNLTKYQIIYLFIFLSILPFTVLDNPFRYQTTIFVLLLTVISVFSSLYSKISEKVSLGHGIFYVMGMYLPIMLDDFFHWNGVILLILSLILMFPICFFSYKLLSKVNKYWFSLFTFILHAGFLLVLNQFVNSELLIQGYLVPELTFGQFEFSSEIYWYVLISLILLICTGIKCYVLDHLNQFDNEKLKLYLFISSGLIASLVGSLTAYYLGYFNYNDVNLIKSFEIAIITVFAGVQQIFSMIIIAYFCVSFNNQFLILQEFSQIIFGIISFTGLFFHYRQIKQHHIN